MTTMASSTTRPVATTSASKVRMLIEKPTAQMAASVPMSDTGMEIAGAMVARNERRKARMMRMTMTFASSEADDHLAHGFADEYRVVAT